MEHNSRSFSNTYNRREELINYSCDYSSPLLQIQKQKPRLMNTITNSIKDYGERSGNSDEDTTNTDLLSSGLINIDVIYDEINKFKQQNKILLSQVMGYEPELSKIAHLKAQINNASRKNRTLTFELASFSKTFNSFHNESSLISGSDKVNKYQKWLEKIQLKFREVQQKLKINEATKEPSPEKVVQNVEVDDEIYKEKQETKVLRVEYESILDDLDKQIERLERAIENK